MTDARSLQTELTRQLWQLDPERETCTECRGSGCFDCNQEGSWPRETTRLAHSTPRDRRTPAEWTRDITAAHDAVRWLSEAAE